MTMLSFQIFISNIAGMWIMFVLSLLVALALYKKHDTKDFYTIFFSSTTAMFTTFALKLLFKVPRPTDMIVIEHDYRFPSGHATMAAVVMSLIIHYTHLHVKNKTLRYALYALAIGWYMLVSYSRLYLQVHYPIDVIVGGLIGTVATLFVVTIFHHLHYYKK